jgi:hypothetical protein
VLLFRSDNCLLVSESLCVVWLPEFLLLNFTAAKIPPIPIKIKIKNKMKYKLAKLKIRLEKLWLLGAGSGEEELSALPDKLESSEIIWFAVSEPGCLSGSTTEEDPSKESSSAFFFCLSAMTSSN